MSQAHVLKTELEEPISCELNDGFGGYLGRWRLARVRPNHDARAAAAFRAQRVPCYVPWCKTTVLTAFDRVKTRFGPLFSGYLFCVLTDDFTQPSSVLRLNPIPDQHRFIDDLARLEAIRCLGVPIETEKELVVGDLVRIRGGHWSGQEGILVRRHNRHRLVVQITAVGCPGISVEVPARWVASKEQQLWANVSRP